MSPFLVTTKRPQPRVGCPASQEAVLERGEDCPLCERSAVAHASEEPVVLSRRAVAALDEAKGEVWAIQAEHDPDAEFAAVPESGGTVGPLPDGTVIEVRSVHIAEIAAGVPVLIEDTPGLKTDESIIAAFNAAQESS